MLDEAGDGDRLADDESARWPALPAERSQELEMASEAFDGWRDSLRRRWLEREQRGESWNGWPF